ncbi:DNA polymerase/3'-5' exonuclease PolX [Alkalibacillus haloalkaliphilus]|uniref:DNA polymerase beta n=1 Tax=Alkalibacillus haloalkaliphilus TaxID=94136 RepID=A0A511W6Z9_9BACI|nr:DNA polymerase/3'-5' exonuclease PolX [Alkalibacillus haloalkaliphilus]GEN45853.1 DNA polymerase/3'-5' exonuclease PolX [Alkalibacillus haloalkaliphilus]
MDKKQVIKHLETIAIYLELKGENAFKISAYRKAAQALERDDRSLSEIDDFGSLQGVGKGTKAVIEEFVESGETETLNELAKEVPEGLIPLLKLQGLGGKKLSRLYHELGVVDGATLREACESGQVEALSGFGKKSVEKILKAIEDYGSQPERLPISSVIPLYEAISAQLETTDGVQRYAIAGSFRRLREDVKDLDYIIATNEAGHVADQLVELANVKEIVSKGTTKVTVVISGEWDISVDFRMVEPEAFITTLHHFTGSKDHNVEMRRLAKQQGYKISEYGIEDSETGEVHTFETEEQFFEFLGVDYIPPELRETGEEVEAEIPQLVSLPDIKGDLHMHTTWSDGAQSIEEMVNKARDYGYQFMAITDHSKYLQVANGLNETRLRKQREAIAEVNEKYDDIQVLSGVEMDILPNGDLDFDDEFLSEMDFVIASIHSHFNQSEAEIMTRLENAIKNPYVDMIAHPTGRLIGRREGYAFDYERFIQLAVENNTIIELNANPNRLDLAWSWLQVAQEQGATIAINTDAHNYRMLQDMKVGVQAARKGWIKKDTVINTWDFEDLQHFLRKKKGEVSER